MLVMIRRREHQVASAESSGSTAPYPSLVGTCPVSPATVAASARILASALGGPDTGSHSFSGQLSSGQLSRSQVQSRCLWPRMTATNASARCWLGFRRSRVHTVAAIAVIRASSSAASAAVTVAERVQGRSGREMIGNHDAVPSLCVVLLRAARIAWAASCDSSSSFRPGGR